MRLSARRLGSALCGIAFALAATALRAAEPSLRVIVHPSRAERLSLEDLRAIYLKQKLFWNDGQPIIAINREAGSAVRERFSETVFAQSSRRLARYWNQRYFEAGEFPPATLASEEAVIRFVAGNRNAVAYVGEGEVPDSVAVALGFP
jgi:ABC-type phosphate transport system substrate-binding protein